MSKNNKKVKKNEHSCKYCDKTFKNVKNRDKHQSLYCKSNPDIQKKDIEEKEIIDEIISNNVELTFFKPDEEPKPIREDNTLKNEPFLPPLEESTIIEDTITPEEENNKVEEEKQTYDSDELFLLEFFKNFNKNRITVLEKDSKILEEIYIRKYKRKMPVGRCKNAYIRMYIFLHAQVKNMIEDYKKLMK